MIESQESLGREIPEFIKELGEISKLFSQEKRQQALDAIWNICSALLPQRVKEADDISEKDFESTSPVITLTVPSGRLIEMGLVSDQTGSQIKRIDSRGTEKNTITIERTTSGGFILTERYMNELHRIDNGDGYSYAYTEEQSQLDKQDGQFNISITGRREQLHLQALDREWIPEQQQSVSEFAPLEVTESRINTTLALLVEGLSPGYIIN